ncbi:MAG: dockerin type I domain-containing protein [Phycisphaeraceae bacterium]
MNPIPAAGLFRCLIAIGAGVASPWWCVGARAQTLAQWLSPVDGSWADPARWSTDPAYPSNGQPGAGDTYDVRVDAAGGPYTVLFDASAGVVTVDRLTIDSPDATVYLSPFSNGFTAANGIDLRQGRLLFSGGRIVDTAITGGGSFDIDYASGSRKSRLEHVTLGVDLSISDSSEVETLGDLALDNATILLQGQQQSARLGGANTHDHAAPGGLNLTGSGRLEVSGYARLYNQVDQTMRFGPGIDVVADDRAGFYTVELASSYRGRIVNEGSITAGAGGTMTMYADELVNSGVIRAIDGGVIDLQIDEDKTVTTAGLGAIQTANGGYAIVRAQIDNSGAVLNLGGDGHDWRLRSGNNTRSRVSGGRINATTTPVVVSDTELSGVTLAGTLAGTYRVYDGLVMDDAKLIVDNARVFFAAGQAITGQGTIEFDDPYDSTYRVQFGHYEQAGSVFIGPGVVLHSLTNLRRNIEFYDTISEATILFDGTTDRNGAGLVGRNFTNRGLIHVRGGNPVLQGASFNAVHAPFVNEGEIRVESGVHIRLGNGFENPGTLTLKPDTAVTFYGSNTIAAYQNIDHQGAAFEVQDQIDLLGGTFDFQAIFGDAKHTLDYDRPEFKNGRILDSAGDLVLFYQGSDHKYFTDVQFASDTSLFGYNRASLSGDIGIPAGVTFYLGLVPQGVSDTDRAYLYSGAPDGTTISGGGEIVVVNDATNPTHAGIETSHATDMIVGPDITVRTQGGAAFTFEAINRGRVRLDHPQDLMLLDGRWANQGVIEVNAGQVRLGGSFTADRVGEVRSAPGAGLYIVGELDLAGGSFDFDASDGGRWFINQRGRVRNGTIQTTGAPLRVGDYGSGTYDGIGDLESVTVAGEVVVDHRNLLRIFGGLTLEGGRVRVGSEGLTNGELLIVAGNFLLDGTGELLFSGSGTRNELSFANYDGVPEPSFTIGAGVTLRTDGGAGVIDLGVTQARNLGVIAADANLLRVWGAPGRLVLDNAQGALEARNLGSLSVVGLAGEAGTLRVIDGGRIELDGDYRLNRDVTLGAGATLALAGTAELDARLTVGAGATLQIDAQWANRGRIELQGGQLKIVRAPDTVGDLSLGDGSLAIAGALTTDQLAVLPIGDATVQVVYGGVIHNQSRLIDLGVDVGVFELRGGRLEGGFVGSTVGASLFAVAATSELDGLQSIDAAVRVAEGAVLSIRDSSWTVPVSVRAGGRLDLEGAGWANLAGVESVDGEVRLNGLAPHLGAYRLTRSTLSVATAGVGPAGEPAAIRARVLADAVGFAEQATIALRPGAEVDSQGDTLDLDDASLTWRMQGGTLRGGRVRATGDAVFEVDGGGVLDTVRVEAPIHLVSPGVLELTDGTTAAGGLSFNHRSGAPATVRLGDNQSLAGFGDIVFEAGGPQTNRVQSPGGTLDIPAGAGVVARDGGGGTVGTLEDPVVNRGALSARGAGSVLRIRGSTVTNAGGTLHAVDAGTLDLQWMAGSLGELEVRDDATLVLYGVFEFDRPTRFDDVTVSLAGAWSVGAPLRARDTTMHWLNTPYAGKERIDVANSRVYLSAPATLADLPSSLAGNRNHLTLRAYGSLDLGAGASAGLGYRLTLDGGTLRNGTVDGADADALEVLSSSTLRDVVVSADLAIAGGAQLQLSDTTIGAVTLSAGEGGEFVVTAARSAVFDSSRVQAAVQNHGGLVVRGPVSIAGDYTQSHDAALTLGLYATPDGGTGSDRLAVGGVAELAGTLRVESSPGQPFAFMDRFELLQLTDPRGWFHDLVLPDLPDGLSWERGYLQSDGVLLVVSVQGDTDGDGVVDQADLSAVMNHFGQQVGAHNRPAGDLSGDGRVGVEDLDAVLASWQPVAAAPTPVPEPAGFGALVLCAGLGLSRPARRREDA